MRHHRSAYSFYAHSILLSLWIEPTPVRSSGGVSGGTWGSGDNRYRSKKNDNDNDYLATTLRRMQEQLETSEGEKPAPICVLESDAGDTCGSTYYVYKDFEEDGGVTFSQAHAATAYEADLEGCVLAPIYSYQDLVDISESIPPCKAAYTAAHKDPLRTYRESKSCFLNGRVPYNCDYSTLGEALESLWGGNEMGRFGSCSLGDWFGDDFTDGQIWCPALKSNWVNFGNKGAIPSDVWRSGDSSYCGDGPIPNAAAAFATDYDLSTGEPSASLKAVNSGEYLSGAVYKCCQDDVVVCYTDGGDEP